MAGRPATLRVNIVSDADTRGFDKAEKRAGAFGGKMGKAGLAVGRLAVLGGAAAGALAVGFGVKAVQAADRTQQAYGALDSVFGQSARTVKAWAEQAVTSTGLARDEYAQLAAVIGAGLKNSGIKDYTAQTDILIKKGADLAATFGGTTSEAVAALGSLMRGETDPIERYGVSIKQSDVQARLAATGQDKLTGAARRTAEQQARLDLVMQQTKATTGQFSRESNTLSGQWQRLKARGSNLAGTIGARIIPTLTAGLTWVNRLGSGSGKAGGMIDRLRAAGRFLGDVLRTFVTPIVAGLQRGVDRIRDAFAKATSKSDNLKTAGRALGTIMRTTARIVGPILGVALEGLGTIIAGVVRVVDGLIGGIRAAIGWLSDLKDSISGSWFGKAVSLLGGGGPIVPMAVPTMAGGPALAVASMPSSLTASTRVVVSFDDARLEGLITAVAETVVERAAWRAARGRRYA